MGFRMRPSNIFTSSRTNVASHTPEEKQANYVPHTPRLQLTEEQKKQSHAGTSNTQGMGMRPTQTGVEDYY